MTTLFGDMMRKEAVASKSESTTRIPKKEGEKSTVAIVIIQYIAIACEEIA